MTLRPGNIIAERVARIEAGLESGIKFNIPFPTEQEERDQEEFDDHLMEIIKNNLIANDIYHPILNPDGKNGRNLPFNYM